MASALASPVPRMAGEPRRVIRPDALVRGADDEAFGLRIGLPSYRSLPLCCIERVGLSIDGRAVEPAAMRLRLADVSHALDELPSLTEVWWFILDTAVLDVRGSLAPGRHEVELTIVTVEPYISNGRFSFTHTDSTSLTVPSAGENR